MSGYLDALSDDERDFLVRLAKSGDLVAEEFHVLPAADGCAPSLPEGVASYSNNAEAIARYARLTDQELRNRVLGAEFAAAVDATIPGGGVATVAGPVICPHGNAEVFCRECDLKARAALHDAVAVAVMAERERCAKIAEAWRYSRKGVNARITTDGQDIAVKIRSGE